MGLWAAISVPWIRREMHKETQSWELDCGISPNDETALKNAALNAAINENGTEQNKDPVPEPPLHQPEP